MKLNIYMKSGNKIVVSNVKDWGVKSIGNDVSELRIEYSKFRLFGERLLISSINLSQIEAITTA